MTWTNEKPTSPGWYWYHDEHYGPAPVRVCLDWLNKQPSARELLVGLCCGQGIDGVPVQDLYGKWHPIEEPSDDADSH